MEVSIPDNLPMVKIDPVLFEQVLFNLIDNAAKYSQDRTRIALSAWADESQVYLRVLDEGSGIPPGDLERIFDSFYRVRKLDHVTGTGLGLSICRGFIEAMGGSVRAENRPDRKGAMFTITMPRPSPSQGEQQ